MCSDITLPGMPTPQVLGREATPLPGCAPYDRVDHSSERQASQPYRQLQAQLRRCQQLAALGQIAGGIAHDLNNLLTLLLGYGSLLDERLRPNDPARALAAEICQAGEQAAALLRRLLALGRRTTPERRVVNLNALVVRQEELLRPLLGAAIELRTALDPRLGEVEADPAALEQVLLNLALNARDAMPKGGRLLLKTANVEQGEGVGRGRGEAQPGPHVLLIVRDSGCGMDEATRTRLFEPFFTTKAPGLGTGLGLTTVRETIRQCQGHIALTSAPGQGTTFRIYLPRQQEPIPAHASFPPRAAEAILLLED